MGLAEGDGADREQRRGDRRGDQVLGGRSARGLAGGEAGDRPADRMASISISFSSVAGTLADRAPSGFPQPRPLFCYIKRWSMATVKFPTDGE